MLAETSSSADDVASETNEVDTDSYHIMHKLRPMHKLTSKPAETRDTKDTTEREVAKYAG